MFSNIQPLQGWGNNRLTSFAIHIEAFQASVLDESNYPFLIVIDITKMNRTVSKIYQPQRG
jgi:hypothetical protein